jgi:hypothetical protein
MEGSTRSSKINPYVCSDFAGGGDVGGGGLAGGGGLGLKGVLGAG